MDNPKVFEFFAGYPNNTGVFGFFSLGFFSDGFNSDSGRVILPITTSLGVHNLYAHILRKNITFYFLKKKKHFVYIG